MTYYGYLIYNLNFQWNNNLLDLIDQFKKKDVMNKNQFKKLY